MIKRSINISKLLQKNKVAILYGPRQVGKTTLIKEYLKSSETNYIFKTGDDIGFAADFGTCSLDWVIAQFPQNSLVFIDEAQKIPNIGQALKLLVDNVKDVTIIVTGSSSFELANKAGETLTGRKKIETLYPIAVQELLSTYPNYNATENLKNILVYGMYPEVITKTLTQEKKTAIDEITFSYLLKDILMFENIKNSKLLLNLLKLLAFQVGQLVSITELGSNLGVDKNTVARYIDLLEKSFVIVSIGGFSRNLRNEVVKMNKYYFYDVGVRNAIIKIQNDIEGRDDAGQLLENFLVIERMKRNSYLGLNPNYYFWRSYEQSEIDLIEEQNGKLSAFEFKWKKDKSPAPKEWVKAYPDATFEVVTSTNFLDFVKY